MAFHHRKLIAETVNVTITIFCPPQCSSSCPSICHPHLISPPYPHSSSSHKPSTALTVILVLAFTFLSAGAFTLYLKLYSRRNRSTARSQGQQEDTHDEFVGDDHGPQLDHPIWYIQTVGLQPSVISAISVCKYKRDDGLVEGTECAVCLNEFQEDETLRLLPKCSHAFHIPCIDTWLRSHTNCPMCRSGIVVDAASGSSSGTGAESSGTVREVQIEGVGNDRESEREIGDGDCELRYGTEEEDENSNEEEDYVNRAENSADDLQPSRRSISMDSPSASMIRMGLVDVVPAETAANSDTQIVKSNMGTVPNKAAGNQSLVRLVGNSSRGRSLQLGPVSMKRSLSCGAKLLLQRYSRSQNSVLPL